MAARSHAVVRRKIRDYAPLDKGFRDGLHATTLWLPGGLTFSKQQMVDLLGCANFTAARRLSLVLQKLAVVNASELYNLDPLALVRVKGVGMATVYVAMCLLDYSGFSVELWWGWSDDRNRVKFSTFKAKAVTKAKRKGTVSV
jgi:hypothetical protein